MQYRYAMVYKPYDILCSPRDRLGRPNLTTLGIAPGLQPVGRLDLDSEGFLLLTDDGKTLHRITHPAFHHPKTYLVLVLGQPTLSELDTLRSGVELRDGLTRPADVEVISQAPVLPDFPRPLPAADKTSWLRIVLHEGKKRQIRRMTAAVNHPTLRLIRVAIGPLALPVDLDVGQWRELTPIERKVLLDWVWPRGRPPDHPARKDGERSSRARSSPRRRGNR